MNLTTILAGLLALSMLANVWLGNRWLSARNDATQATEQRDQSRQAASVCNDATEDLRTSADKQALIAKESLEKARKSAIAREQRAQTILSTPASVPGDDCASATQRAHDWLANRGKP